MDDILRKGICQKILKNNCIPRLSDPEETEAILVTTREEN